MITKKRNTRIAYNDTIITVFDDFRVYLDNIEASTYDAANDVYIIKDLVTFSEFMHADELEIKVWNVVDKYVEAGRRVDVARIFRANAYHAKSLDVHRAMVLNDLLDGLEEIA